MLLRHSALYLLARGLPGLISLFAVAVYTRLLAPDAYGQYALVAAGVGLGNKLLFEWLRLALLRFLPALQERSQAQVLKATIAGAFLGLVAVTAVAGGVALVLVSDPVLRKLVAAGLALLWIHALFDLELERLRSQLLPMRYGLMALGRAALSLAFGVALVALGFGPLGLILGLVLGMIIAVARPLLEDVRDLRLSRCNRALMGQLSRYGAPLAVTAALGFITHALDRFMIGWLFSDDAVGRYTAAYDLASVSIGLLLTIINLAAYPLIVRALEEHGPELARRRLAVNLTALIAIGLPAAIGLIVLARPVADVLLGEQFRADAAALIPLIVVAALLRDFKAFYLDLAFQLGRNTIGQVWVAAATAGANVLLNLWWIPAFGTVGAACAAIVAYALALVLSAILGRRSFTLPWPTIDSLKVALAAAGMGVVVWQLTDSTGIVPLLGQILCGVLVYGLLLWLLDAAAVRSRFPEVLGRVRPSALRE